MVKRMAVVEQATGLVANVIALADGAQWRVPDGHVLVVSPDSGAPGDTYADGVFTRAPAPAPEEPPARRQRQIDVDAIKAALPPETHAALDRLLGGAST